MAGRVEAEHGVIDAPLGRLGITESNAIWVRQGVIPEGDPRKSASARTEFWRVADNDAVSLLRLRAHTGRMHQLRAHLAHIGHPVLGDKIYGPDPALYLSFIEQGWTAEHERRLLIPRHALHAHRLEFSWAGVAREFAVPLPEGHVRLGAQTRAAGVAVDLRATESCEAASRRASPTSTR